MTVENWMINQRILIISLTHTLSHTHTPNTHTHTHTQAMYFCVCFARHHAASQRNIITLCYVDLCGLLVCRYACRTWSHYYAHPPATPIAIAHPITLAHRVVGQQSGVLVQHEPAILPALHHVRPLAQCALQDRHRIGFRLAAAVVRVARVACLTGGCTRVLRHPPSIRTRTAHAAPIVPTLLENRPPRIQGLAAQSQNHANATHNTLRGHVNTHTQHTKKKRRDRRGARRLRLKKFICSTCHHIINWVGTAVAATTMLGLAVSDGVDGDWAISIDVL